MHTILPYFLAMIVAIVLLEMIATKLKIAYPILLVVAGLLLSFVPALPNVKVNPDIVFFILLPPLLSEAAWSVSFKEMKKWWRIIGSFAFLVVFFTALSVAVFANFYIPGFTLALFFIGRNRFSSGCCQYGCNYQICQNPEKHFRYIGRRKFT